MSDVPLNAEETQRVLQQAVEAADAETASLQLLLAQLRGRQYTGPVADVIGAAYAIASAFIFQLIMGLALINATYLFVGGASGVLRPWESYGLIDGLAFALLIVAGTIRIFTYTAGLHHNFKHRYPFKGGAALFVMDSFFGIVTALLFYVLSLTVAYNHFDSGKFLVVFGAILLLESILAALNLLLPRTNKSRFGLDLLLNLLVGGGAAGLWYFKLPHFELNLLLFALARTLFDIGLMREIVVAMRALRQSRYEARRLDFKLDHELQSLKSRLEEAQETKATLVALTKEVEKMVTVVSARS